MKIIWNIQARIEIYQYTDSFDTRTDTPIISCPIREQQSPPPPITFRKTVPFIERRFLSRAASRSASKENIPIRANFNSGNHFTKAHPSLAHTDAHKIGVFASLFSSSLSNVPRVGQRNTTNQLPSVIYIYISRKGHEGGEVARHAKRNGRGGKLRGLESRGRASKEIMKLRARQESARFIDKRAQEGRAEVRRGKI